MNLIVGSPTGYSVFNSKGTTDSEDYLVTGGIKVTRATTEKRETVDPWGIVDQMELLAHQELKVQRVQKDLKDHAAKQAQSAHRVIRESREYKDSRAIRERSVIRATKEQRE